MRLIWKQKIWLAICEFLFRDFPVNQVNFKFCTQSQLFALNFNFLHYLGLIDMLSANQQGDKRIDSSSRFRLAFFFEKAIVKARISILIISQYNQNKNCQKCFWDCFKAEKSAKNESKSKLQLFLALCPYETQFTVLTKTTKRFPTVPSTILSSKCHSRNSRNIP